MLLVAPLRLVTAAEGVIILPDQNSPLIRRRRLILDIILTTFNYSSTFSYTLNSSSIFSYSHNKNISRFSGSISNLP